MVRIHRPGRPIRKYAIELRFVDPVATVARRIAWSWWRAATILMVLALLAQWLPAAASLALALSAISLGCLGLWRTREVVELRSVHGCVPLAGVSGRLGSARAAGAFIAEVARRVQAAQRSRSGQHFLRDEMREHHRLWSEGVLPDALYEAGKRRILRAHDVGLTASDRALANY